MTRKSSIRSALVAFGASVALLAMSVAQVLASGPTPPFPR